MLHHFAITPEVFAPESVNFMSPPGVVLIEILKGLCQNGLLANLHAGRWITEVKRQQAHKELPASVRDHIEKYLSLLHDRNRFITHPAGAASLENDELRWIKWSLERHRADCKNQMAGVISTDDFISLSEINDEGLIRISEALYAECWNNRKCSARFTKTHSNFRNQVAPIVRYARKVNLIDPYLNCREPRFFDTVQTVAEMLGKHDNCQTPGTIHIHAGDPELMGPENLRESVNDRLNRWGVELQPVADYWGHVLRVFLWGKKPGGKKQHDRYIITDQCGVEAPGGLDFLPDDEAAAANFTTWSLLEPEQTRTILLEEYHKSKSPYEHLGSTQIDPRKKHK
jgi:hypothetical protein